MKNVVILAFLLSGFQAIGQAPSLNPRDSRKGDFYFYWGWNREVYSKSDISFEGDDYSFVLKDVVATDIQTEFAVDPYMNPGRLTIPQTNFRIGYFINEHYNISFGFDHMKYVVKQYQTVTIDGEIDGTGTRFDGTYDNDEIELSKDFLQFEHTDGLNYLVVDLRRVDNLFSHKKMVLSLTEGIGLGALMPRTDAELMNFGDNDYYHLSGFGVNGMVGLNITFFNTFFIQSELKGGYITMPDMRTTNDEADKASQAFWFGQYNLVLGGVVNLGTWKKKSEKRP